MNEEIDDPVLQKYLKRTKIIKTVKPDITKIRDAHQNPDPSVSVVIDGVPQHIERELILTEWKCNKCARTFNHTPRQTAAGIMPACPDCDK